MTKLKCWKRVKHKDFIEFIKGTAGIKIVDFESGDLRRKGYSTYIRGKGDRFAYKTEHKTKSQALKFANKYMKSHDKC